MQHIITDTNLTPSPLMKRILYAILLTVSVFINAGAQTNALTTEEDSTIYVIAWFNKSDTTEYEYTSSEMNISGSDTTVTSSIDEEFRIVVLDSTSDGYRLKYEPLSWKTSNEKDSLKQGAFWTAKSQGPVVFKASEYGEIEQLENWRTVRDNALPAMLTFFDSLYNRTPALDSIMPKKNYMNLIRLGFNGEEAIRSIYKDVNTLFDLHGNVYIIGITEKNDSSTGYPVHVSTLVTYEEPDTAETESYYGDYNIRTNGTVTFPESEVKDLTSSFLGALFSDTISTEAEKFVNDSLNTSMEIRVLTDYHFFYSGWPKLIRKQTITRLGDISTKIKTETTEWTRYRWNEATTEDKEDGTPSRL